VRDRWRHFPAIAIVFLLPLYFMVSGSLRKAGLPPPRTAELLPSPLAWGNYGRAFDLVDIPRYTLNSLLVVAFAVPLTIIVSSWAAFAR
jgi:multiple sugar transport system permease protein